MEKPSEGILFLVWGQLIFPESILDLVPSARAYHRQTSCSAASTPLRRRGGRGQPFPPAILEYIKAPIIGPLRIVFVRRVIFLRFHPLI
ncbi:hypothetical protein NPIL_621731 [Nephila pilipes]|uniref:Uncharacterized protein n=1 Tax=Nephila pilipes TaxID=299642 RepID=A0A8X6QZV8_NEPPI|nr:hypothetical protein NPIL_621731 [Nephila pilipes]